jgi:alpha-1,2-mannosyltransferase
MRRSNIGLDQDSESRHVLQTSVHADAKDAMADNKLPNNPVTRPGCWPKNSGTAFFLAVLLWVVPMLVITAMVIHNPRSHTVTFGSYHKAAEAWWSGGTLYDGPRGMNYLPHFAILYSPFHFLPETISEILWRVCAAAALSIGLWQLMRELFAKEPEFPFLWATLLMLPLSLGALRNGNANAIFGGVTLLAVAGLLRGRWWTAIVWMALAVAIKPIGIVLLLLSAIYYRPVMLRFPIAILALAVFPFCFATPQYAWAQYHDMWQNLKMCAAVSEHRFADLNGLLRTIGTPLSAKASTIMRAVCGALTAVIWLWGARLLAPPGRHLWLYALATAYLMLFNPMTESNSYAILAPALAVWAVCFLCHPELKNRRLGWAVTLIALSMGLLPTLLRQLCGNYFALFWFPLMTIVFVVLLTCFIARSSALPYPAAKV